MLAKLKKRKRLRLHGFLRRSVSQDGREVLARRRRKGRHSLVVALPRRYKSIKGKAKLHIIAGGTARKSPFDGKGNYVKVVKQLVKQENTTPKASKTKTKK